MAILNGVCKLCLEIYENFEVIDENTKIAFDILLPKMDSTVIQELVMCKNCADTLTKCFDFKVKCLHTHDYIVPFANKHNVQLSLRNVDLSKNLTDMNIPENAEMCKLCMGLVKKCSAASLDVEERDILLEKMMEQCLPELDLSKVEKSVICAPCLGSLENCFRFVMNCLNAEEKIKKYCERADINSKNQKELNSLSQFTISDVTSIEVGIIKLEKFCDWKGPDEEKISKEGDITRLEQMFFDDSKVANKDVEDKNKSFMKFDGQKVNEEQQFNNILTCEENSNKRGSIKEEAIFWEENETKYDGENLAEMEDQKGLFDEEIEIKTDEHDFKRFGNNNVLPQSEVSLRLHRRENCLLSNPDCDPSKPNMNRKRTLKNKSNVHLPSEITMYNCDSCSFQSKYKFHLKRHSLVHKDPSEVTMHKCGSCSYQTMNKVCLEGHSLTHKNPSEVTMYKCDSCPFQTKYRYSLKQHLLKHKDPAQLTMYKCDACSFQTKYKFHLRRHSLEHKAPSEVTMVKCNSCSFQTKYKSSLRLHLLKHKNPSESFKSSLKHNLLKHKNPSEVTLYECDSCSYQAIHEFALKRHLLLHKGTSEVAKYKCDFCSFRTKNKHYIKRHLLVHKDPSEITTYKCDSCSFKTHRIYYLKKHLLKHKDPSEISSVHQIGKDDLKKYLYIHKDPSEITVYKCDSCSFQTKVKFSIKEHMMNHRREYNRIWENEKKNKNV